MNKTAKIQQACRQCGTVFMARADEVERGKGRYCSRRCKGLARRTGTEFICAECGAQFYRNEAEQRKHKGSAHYCSHACAQTAAARNLKSYKKQGDRHLHRVVVEKLLGRALRRGEVVHHRDGNKQNNDPSNLELLPSRAAHSRLHAEMDAPRPHGVDGKFIPRKGNRA